MMVKKSVIHREELSFRLLRTAFFLLPPVTAFYLMQFLYGAWPWQTAPGAALANVICVGALYFLMCGLTGWPAVYRTLAFHPGERTSWQRDRAYPRLGFDQFKCGEDMDVPQSMEHGYVSDRSDFEQIIWEFEHKAEGEPLFLFNVTIQNHGSYTVEDYPTRVQLTDAPGKYPMAEQYLTLANETDLAFQQLIDYFSQQEEPTILVMFGDHQPSVEQEFLDRAYGVRQEDMTMEQYMGRFRVPFVLWANYPVEWEGPEETSLNFLGQYLLRYAGIEADPYGAFLWDLQKTLPALTFVGYTDALGEAYSHLETNAYTGKIEDYQRVQYDRLFDGGAAAALYQG